MAKATKHVDPIDPPYTLTLELSQREAEVLASVLPSITSVACAGLYRELREAGVRRLYLVKGAITTTWETL